MPCIWAAFCTQPSSRCELKEYPGSTQQQCHLEWVHAKNIEAVKRVIRDQAAVDPAERMQLEKEIATFLLDNYLTDLTYYSVDPVWPVGPRIEEWTQHVETSDIRQVNGYEFIRHRR